jgi:hypothetical protein
MEITERLHTTSREQWREWLAENHSTKREIWISTTKSADLAAWAFYAEDEARRVRFEEIPDCDILLTHCQAKIGTQCVVLQECKKCGSDFGDPILTDVLRTKRIGWVISGHIHSGNHNVEMLGDIQCCNCSIMDERYKESYPAFEFEV